MARIARFGQAAESRSFRLTDEAMLGLEAIASIGGVTVAEFLNRLGMGDTEAAVWVLRFFMEGVDGKE